MIQGNFNRIERSKPIGSSGGHFYFVVQTLYSAKRKDAFCLKPVEDQTSMFPQGLGDVFHRFDSRTHDTGAPLIQELSCPEWHLVFPEALEVLLEQIAPDRLEIESKQIGQLDLLGVGQVLGPFEQKPPRISQNRLVTFGDQFLGLFGTDLSDG